MTTETRIFAQIIQDADGYHLEYPQREANSNTGTPALTYRGPSFPTLADAMMSGAIGHAPADFRPWWNSAQRAVNDLMDQAARRVST
jgi:hypothetical protein